MLIFPCLVVPGGSTLGSAHLKKGKKAPGEKPPALTPVPDNAECGKNLACSSRQLAASADRRFKISKRAELFIRTHDKPLSVVAMRVCDPDCSPLGVDLNGYVPKW
jgi:hypothetical protein